MSGVAIAIIVAGVFISWRLEEIAKAISKNKEDLYEDWKEEDPEGEDR